MDEAKKPRRDERSRTIKADVDALGAIDDDTLAAVRALQAEETALHQRFLDGDLTDDQHYALWLALRKRTPHAVHIAGLKLAQMRSAAVSNDLDATDA